MDGDFSSKKAATKAAKAAGKAANDGKGNTTCPDGTTADTIPKQD